MRSLDQSGVAPREGGSAGQTPPSDASTFSTDMLSALARRPRQISPKYFYDTAGSALFDRICQLPEYYPTRTELELLRQSAAEISRLAGTHTELIEFGAGSLTKARILLDALHSPDRFIPIDISGDHLRRAATSLKQDYPELDVMPLVRDYSRDFQLPLLAERGRTLGVRRIGFFPGSTIGNFTPDEALRFLRMAARELRGGALLLGADLIKDPALLHAAYNDRDGVTAAFNLNLLVRANRELGADFNLDQFSHYAFYNAPERRIEMHLMSRSRQVVMLQGKEFEFDEGETLHTENSYKFTIEGLRTLASLAGFEPRDVWTDSRRLFSLHWLIAPGEPI